MKARHGGHAGGKAAIEWAHVPAVFVQAVFDPVFFFRAPRADSRGAHAQDFAQHLARRIQKNKVRRAAFTS